MRIINSYHNRNDGLLSLEVSHSHILVKVSTVGNRHISDLLLFDYSAYISDTVPPAGGIL